MMPEDTLMDEQAPDEEGDNTFSPELGELEADPDVVLPDNVDESDEANS